MFCRYMPNEDILQPAAACHFFVILQFRCLTLMSIVETRRRSFWEYLPQSKLTPGEAL